MQLVGRGMQSLRGAWRESAGSRSGRVAGETEELEEGEACSDTDGEAFVDPDVALSYITRKYKGDASAIMNKEVNIQVPASQNEKMMNTNNENGFEVGFARKEIPASVKHGQLYMQPTSSVATRNADPVPAPVVIKDHWVRCDICQKLRLLPYGTNLSMLPKKWKCTMLHWLPGMNRCDISEDETTEALNALFAIPATATTFSSGSPHTAGTGTAASSAYNISGQFERSRKRKNSPSNGKDLAESSYHTPSLTPSMSNQQDPIRDERTTDDTRYSSERDSVSKHGPRPVSKSADLISEKLKPKHKNHSSYSDEGIMERTKAHPKVKTKIGIDQDEQKTYKKTKTEDWHQIDRGQDHMCDSDDVEVPDEPKFLLAKAKTMKGSHETSDMSLRKENIASGYDLLENVKNVNALDVPFHSEKKEHPSGDKKDFNMEDRSPLPDQHSFDRMATALNKSLAPFNMKVRTLKFTKVVELLIGWACHLKKKNFTLESIIKIFRTLLIKLSIFL
ncbi:cysteine-tryptophan domain-containing zinc finger protein 3-like isoform X2 [Miscanthus floridulus]|uniref:cysteine-tryptophan domain-containing zinc finger protein 3-like isoform X2 n=1 Tax=Miscanthus floridulus TaxID=154761 RepID=UPI0034593EE4